jgi:hypothetical protein
MQYAVPIERVERVHSRYVSKYICGLALIIDQNPEFGPLGVEI